MARDNSDDDDRSYTVGYGRPPQANRFKPGQSGNPKGRPKGRKNLMAELEESLGKKVDVKMGGKTRKMTRQSVLVERLVQRALEGNDKAIAHLFATLHKHQIADKGAAEEEAHISASERESVERLIMRLGGGGIGDDHE